MKPALRIGLGIVVLLAAVGWPFIWRPLTEDNEFFARGAVEVLMLKAGTGEMNLLPASTCGP